MWFLIREIARRAFSVQAGFVDDWQSLLHCSDGRSPHAEVQSHHPHRHEVVKVKNRPCALAQHLEIDALIGLDPSLEASLEAGERLREDSSRMLLYGFEVRPQPAIFDAER